MHRLIRTGFLFALVVLAGCSNTEEGPRRVEPPNPPEEPKPQPAKEEVRPETPQSKYDALVARIVNPDAHDKYDAVLFTALDHLAQRRYTESLASLEAAKKLRDTPLVKNEIGRVQGLLQQREAARKTVDAIQTVLKDGSPDTASDLAAKALALYGGGDFAAALVDLKRQADLLVAAGLLNDDARFSRFAKESDSDNPRVAALACELALLYREDKEERRQYDALTSKLAAYDDNVRRAAEPSPSGDGLSALKTAQTAWDTPQVRADIGDYNFALLHGRPRIGVADFEVRGNAGLAPTAGRTLADSLAPHFKPHFVPVERQQLARVLGDLKLTANDLTLSPQSCADLDRFGRLHYLVLGSVTPVDGITVHAQLLNLRTGMVEQTAQLNDRTLEALQPRLRTLALVLQMTDEQKNALKNSQAGQIRTPVFVINGITAEAIAPRPDAKDPTPEPIQVYAPQPANLFVGLDARVLETLGQRVIAEPQPIDKLLKPEDPRRGRLLALALEVGDNLLRRGMTGAAQQHFELALKLAAGNPAIVARIERCKKAKQVVAAAPPRLVIFPFQPAQGLPQDFGQETARFGSYFGSNFEVVDQAEAYWYMARLGVAYAQIVNDAVARTALAQALNVRTFCFGTVDPALNVHAYLLDAGTGMLIGSGTLHVQDQPELKMRLGELAAQLIAPQAKAEALVKKGKTIEAALQEARALLKAGKPNEAVQAAEHALKETPASAALRCVRDEALDAQRVAQLKRAVSDVQGRQALLAAADKARAAAEAGAKEHKPDKNKHAVAARLQTEAKKRFDAGNFVMAVIYYRIAANWGLKAEVEKQLQTAEARLANSIRVRADTDAAHRNEERLKALDTAVVRIKKAKDERAVSLRLAADEQKSRSEAAVQKRANRDREAADLLESARKNLKEKAYAKALVAAQNAQHLKPGEEVEHLIEEIRLASVKNDIAIKEEKFRALFAAARTAMAKKEYQNAKKLLGEATDLVPRSPEVDKAFRYLKEAEDARKMGKNLVQMSMTAARETFRAKKYGMCIDALNKVLYFDPENAKALDLLKQARAAKGPNGVSIDDAIKRANEELAKGNFRAALTAGSEAMKIAPADEETRSVMKKATVLSKAAFNTALADGRDAEKKKEWDRAAAFYRAARDAGFNDDMAEFALKLLEGRRAYEAEQYAEAEKALTEALKIMPKDAEAQHLLSLTRAKKS